LVAVLALAVPALAQPALGVASAAAQPPPARSESVAGAYEFLNLAAHGRDRVVRAGRPARRPVRGDRLIALATRVRWLQRMAPDLGRGVARAA